MAQALAVHRSRHLVPEFVLHRPETVADACALLGRYGDDATILAGGIDVISRMKSGAGFAHLVAIAGIAELRGVALLGNALSIGAATTHHELENDTLLRSTMPAVAAYLGGVGNIRIRCQGTIGGNLMADEAGYEIAPLLLVLDATLHFRDPAQPGPSRISVRDFVRSRGPGQRFGLLTAISIPLAAVDLVWNRHLRPTLALVAGVHGADGGAVAASAALVGAHRRAAWAPVALAASSGAAISAARWAADLPDPDLPGAPEPAYARRVGAVLLCRALTAAGLDA